MSHSLQQQFPLSALPPECLASPGRRGPAPGGQVASGSVPASLRTLASRQRDTGPGWRSGWAGFVPSLQYILSIKT